MIVVRFLFLIFLSISTYAHIPRGILILQKAAENNGSGTYVVEQEVQFQNNQDVFVLKETWTIESDNQMRLQVSGSKDYKDLIRLNFQYANGMKYFMQNNTRYSQKLNDEFFEKYFHFRKGDNFANQLIHLKIVPSSIFNKRSVKTDYQPESFMRLSRFGGVVNYAFGTPSLPDSLEQNPGLWIEQDQFVLRKLRLPSQLEITAEKHSPYARGLMYPRKRTVRWDNNLVTLQTLNVSGKAPSAKPNLENNKLEGLDSLAVKTTIEEFYKRFR